MKNSIARRVTLLVAVAVVVLASCTGPGHDSDKSSAAAPATSRPPTLPSGGGVQNPAFYYAGTSPLRPGADLSALGKPSLVVTLSRANERNAIRAIHQIGAKAYRYVQFYWAPDKGSYEGIDLGRHPEWAFCRTGDQPLRGRTTTAPDGVKQNWYFLDANERAVRDQIARILARYKAMGWDGVMWDRGGAATQTAVDAAGRPVWDARSSCTAHPDRPGAYFADAYVNMLGLARQAGLQVMLNTGASPYDPLRPFRPDPGDPHCRDRDWRRCTFIEGGLNQANLVLNESVSFPRDKLWRRTFEANRRAERAGRRVVGLITTYTLGGAAHQNRADVFYEWARVKLFDLPLAVNTGNDKCDGTQRNICNRYASYPDLVDVRFGSPLTRSPRAEHCEGAKHIRCVWWRQYEDGVDVVNVSGRDLSFGIKVPGTGCRHVYDVFAREPLAGDRCVSHVTINLPAWSGRPLLSSTHPWRR